MDYFAFDELGSTNERALELWQLQGGRLVVTARTQTAGVGRSGRKWLSPRGGLWMTMAWPMGDQAKYEAMPLVVGLAVRDALAEAAGVEGKIKWPNDVLVGGKKVAGILCRAEVGREQGVILIGVGVNVNFGARELGEDLRQPATTVLEETGREIDLERLGRAVAERIEKAVERLEREGIGGMLGAIRRELAWVGERVTCMDYAGEIFAAGVFGGIDESGAALIEAGGEMQAVAIGELHFSRAT